MADNGPAFDDFADYYDIADIDRTPETAFYCGLIRDDARSLLELACGTGTITIPMARRLAEHAGTTARVVGVDESEKMLVMARRNGPNVDWIRGDMRAPPVQGPFDLVVCCFHGYQLLLADEDLLQAFRAVRALLSPNGIYAFDIYQPNLQFLNGSHADRPVRAFSDPQARRLEVRERGEYDPSSRILVTDWRLVQQGSPDGEPIARMRVSMRQYFPEEIERMLDDAGLAMRERYGNYDRSPFTASSKRQVIVCGRA
jgi:SAM-dependent methyltransferase